MEHYTDLSLSDASDEGLILKSNLVQVSFDPD